MILTYKLKHNRDFSIELRKALQVANYAIKHKNCKTTKDVKSIGLKACIANQILRKYGRKEIKKVHKVKLTINGYFIKLNKEKRTIEIPSLKLKLNYLFPNEFIKINQVEADNKYLYVAVEIQNKPIKEVENYIGVDRNTTGHAAVVAYPVTGKVYKLGKQAFHVHRKYKKIRCRLQSKDAKKKLKKLRKREQNIIKNINHQISRKIVDLAIKNDCGIKLENLQGIRKTSKGGKNKKINRNGESFKSSINTWEFYQLQSMIEYKSKICGIPVVYIDPHYTSQKCSRCGLIGSRNEKKFSCPWCGHVDHADSNAAFNIASFELPKQNNECDDQLLVDRDISKGSTDTPRLETQLLERAVA